MRGGIDSALAESVGPFATMVGGGVVPVSNGFQPSNELLPSVRSPSKTDRPPPLLGANALVSRGGWQARLASFVARLLL